MVLNTRTGGAEVKVEDSALVFDGYGVDAPEQDWNDYAGIDVKGKTVVILVNDPGFHAGDESLFEGKRMTYYGRWTYKFEEAARKRSEEHTSELQSLMRISYAVFCLKKTKQNKRSKLKHPNSKRHD